MHICYLGSITQYIIIVHCFLFCFPYGTKGFFELYFPTLIPMLNKYEKQTKLFMFP